MATPPNALRLLLTRPAEDCSRLSQTLAKHGVYSNCLPLLASLPLPETTEQRLRILALDQYQAVLVLSKPAAKLGLALLDRYWPQPPLGPSWFTPGAGSGQILHDYGLKTYWPPQGDTSEAMLALPELQAALDRQNAKALIFAGVGGRTVLADTLSAQGVTVDRLALYRRVLPGYPAGILVQRIKEQRLNALYVSSAQGLQHLIQLAADDWPKLAKLALFVPSARVAQQARAAGFAKVIDCQGASSDALLGVLNQYLIRIDHKDYRYE